MADVHNITRNGGPQSGGRPATVVPFPSQNSSPSAGFCKLAVLEVLCQVEAKAAICPLYKPVELREIYNHLNCEGPRTPWILATIELEYEGLVQTWSRSGQTFLDLTDRGKKHVLGMAIGCGPLPKPFLHVEAGERSETVPPSSRLAGNADLSFVGPAAQTSPASAPDISCGTVEGHGDDAQAELSCKAGRTVSRGAAEIDRTGKGATLAAEPDSLVRNANSAMPLLLEEGETRQVGTQAPPAGSTCTDDNDPELLSDMLSAMPRAELYGLPEKEGR